ncbi:expressed unknown protein [Seminavis robusta]|uniref:Uncharacterized protein n=1 Tax=Seminavis robusta TaxID=568900 RepID=A0A9N8DUX5_9STRA|nr:expressed unknown protein [Seminavis robusta]|eukprot:Sro390_g132831.1  (172) ;mRNA; f:33434-33949
MLSTRTLSPNAGVLYRHWLRPYATTGAKRSRISTWVDSPQVPIIPVPLNFLDVLGLSTWLKGPTKLLSGAWANAHRRRCLDRCCSVVCSRSRFEPRVPRKRTHCFVEQFLVENGLRRMDQAVRLREPHGEFCGLDVLCIFTVTQAQLVQALVGSKSTLSKPLDRISTMSLW